MKTVITFMGGDENGMYKFSPEDLSSLQSDIELLVSMEPLPGRVDGEEDPTHRYIFVRQDDPFSWDYQVCEYANGRATDAETYKRNNLDKKADK